MFSLYVLVLFTLFALARAFTFTVTVGIDETNGQPGIGFDPSTINPVAGDTITFTYQLPDYIKNPTSAQHSATQSTFDSPCNPKSGGFDTGVQSTGSVNSNTGPTFNLVVNDTQPLWFFSSANTDCASGMVLAVNPPTTGDQTAQAFKDKAKTAPSTPESSSSTSSSASATASTSGSSGTSTGSRSSGTSTSSAPTASQSNGAAREQTLGYLGLTLAVIVAGMTVAGL